MAGRRRKPAEQQGNTHARLPDAELEVLACLWRLGSATSRQVRETMISYRPMTHGALTTLLSRLQSKGLISAAKGRFGKAFIYKPTKKARSSYKREIKDMLQRLFGGDSVALVASLFDCHRPTIEELNEMQTLLDDLRKDILEEDLE